MMQWRQAHLRRAALLAAATLASLVALAAVLTVAWDASLPALLPFLPSLTFIESLGLSTLAALGYTLRLLLRDQPKQQGD